MQCLLLSLRPLLLQFVDLLFQSEDFHLLLHEGLTLQLLFPAESLNLLLVAQNGFIERPFPGQKLVVLARSLVLVGLLDLRELDLELRQQVELLLVLTVSAVELCFKSDNVALFVEQQLSMRLHLEVLRQDLLLEALNLLSVLYLDVLHILLELLDLVAV